MGNKIQFKRGMRNQIPELAYGEPAFVSDEQELYIGTESGNIKLTNNIEVENIKGQLNSKTSYPLLANEHNVADITKPYWTIERFGGGINVEDNYKALILVLENALGIEHGEFENGGDIAANSTRYPIPIIFGPGVYNFSKGLIIKYSRISIVGADSGNSIPGTTLQFNTDEDCFYMDCDFYVYEIGFKNIKIVKGENHLNKGYGIHYNGTSKKMWQCGLDIEKSSIRNCKSGINIECGSFTFAYLKIEGSDLSANYEYGIKSTKNMTIGCINNSVIIQNGHGGIKIGTHGFTISNNDLEGQHSPMTLLSGGEISIYGNYFEYHKAGEACICLNNIDTFDIKNNFFSSNIEIPKIYLNGCLNGRCDIPSIQHSCINVDSEPLIGINKYYPNIPYTNKSLCVRKGGNPNGAYNIAPLDLIDNWDYDSMIKCYGNNIKSKIFTGVEGSFWDFLPSDNQTANKKYNLAFAFKLNNNDDDYKYATMRIIATNQDGSIEYLCDITISDDRNTIKIGDICLCYINFTPQTNYTKLRFFIYPKGINTIGDFEITESRLWEGEPVQFGNIFDLV